MIGFQSPTTIGPGASEDSQIDGVARRPSTSDNSATISCIRGSIRARAPRTRRSVRTSRLARIPIDMKTPNDQRTNQKIGLLTAFRIEAADAPVGAAGLEPSHPDRIGAVSK